MMASHLSDAIFVAGLSECCVFEMVYTVYVRLALAQCECTKTHEATLVSQFCPPDRIATCIIGRRVDRATGTRAGQITVFKAGWNSAMIFGLCDCDSDPTARCRLY